MFFIKCNFAEFPVKHSIIMPFLLLKRVPGNHNDCGYSSGHDSENCSIPSSHNGSDVACSEGMCNHDGRFHLIVSFKLMCCTYVTRGATENTAK